METQNSTLKAEIAKSTSYKRHRNQFYWQILAPIGLGFLLLAAVGVIVVLTATTTNAGGPVSQWADASLIWLVLPILMVAIVAILVLFTIIYLVAQILDILPPYTFLVRHYFNIFSLKVQVWSNKTVRPLIAIKSQAARVEAFFTALLGKSKS